MTRPYDRPAPRHDDEGERPRPAAPRRRPAARPAAPSEEYYLVHEATRFGTLCAYLDSEMKEESIELAFIFAKNRYIAHDLAYSLNLNGFDCEVYEPASFDDRLRRLEREGRPGLFVVSDFDMRRVPMRGATHALHFHLANEPDRYEARLENAEGDGIRRVAFLTAQEHAALLRHDARLKQRLAAGAHELDDLLGEYRFSRDPDADRPGADRPGGRDRDRGRDGDRGRGPHRTGDRSGGRVGERGRDRSGRGRSRDEFSETSRDPDDDHPSRRGRRRDRDAELEGYLSMHTEQDGRRFVYRYKYYTGAAQRPDSARG